MKQKETVVVCPVCRKILLENHYQYKCKFCKRQFLIKKGIPLLFYEASSSGESGITSRIKSFYEKTPFPNYDNLDSTVSLRKKAEKNIFTKALNDQTPFGSHILEIGCGTGQLTNYLALTGNRFVCGVDISINSLNLAQQFKSKYKIKGATFLQMNLFYPAFPTKSFDVVICTGVLHHTADPYKGFQIIAQLVKKRGFIILGLYHKYGRLLTDFRRFIFLITRNRLKFLDTRLVDKNTSDLRKDTWFLDQYKNPHESKHTISEVINWLDKNNFNFISSVPQTLLFETVSGLNLFQKQFPSTRLERFLIEQSMFITNYKDGGFFTIVGQKYA